MATKLQATIKGGPAMATKLTRLGPLAVKAGMASLYRSGEAVMTDSKENYVPIDTGALKSSGNVQVIQGTNGGGKIALGYGGPAAPYAVYVHEMNKNYNKGKVWKYLQTPLQMHEPQIATDLANDVQAALKGL